MKLSRVNTCLLVIIVIINGYIIAMPFVPGIAFWFESRGNGKEALTQKLHESAARASTPTKDIPEGNRLIIPAMLLDIPFYEGPDARTLNKGVWLRPQGSVPEQGGNSVIAGHRFTYTNPRGDFYHLDKLKAGDEIGVFRHGTKYMYTVRETKVVKATEVSVEAPTDHTQLTLYTCTPLWLPKERLVVIATPAPSQERTTNE